MDTVNVWVVHRQGAFRPGRYYDVLLVEATQGHPNHVTLLAQGKKPVLVDLDFYRVELTLGGPGQ